MVPFRLMDQSETIIARRVTEDEFCLMEKLEYVNGRIVTGPGIELFVGVKEFPESIKAWEEEKLKETSSPGFLKS
jgi:hypothetical protein